MHPRPPSASRRPHPQALVAIGLILLAVYALRHTLSTTTLLVFAVIVPSIILHEVSHGVVALACGDDTARRAGRLTLNPLRHVDPVGTLVLPAVLALSGLGAFGYAKPVPVNPARMRSPRNGSLVTSLAGPAVNAALAGLSIVVLRVVRPPGTVAALSAALSFGGLGAVDLVDRVIFLLGFLNVTLMVFNLIPLPPLDGSAVVERLLPASAWPAWLQVRRYAMPVLLVLVLVDGGRVLSHVFGPAERAWVHLLTG
ncbi:MAG TPA: site-2 protease family protein [Acidimicrobiales bacterium]|nr:site-2 protease family protein [Acidimicrobiales bacterium]